MRNVKFGIVHFILIASCLLSFTHMNAQTYTYKISEEEIDTRKLEYSSERTIIKVPVEGGLLCLFATKKEATLQLLNADMRVVKEAELFGGLKSAYVYDLINANGKIFFLYAIRKKDIFSLYAKEIDPKTLTVKNENNITEFYSTDEDDIDDWWFRTLYSPDSSKILFYSDYREFNGSSFQISKRRPSRTPQKIMFTVMDRSMNRLFKKEYVFPFEPRYMKIIDFIAGQDGSMYVLYNYYPGEIRSTRAVAYEPRLLKLGEKEDKEISIQLDGLAVETMAILQQPNGTVNILGTYRKDLDAGSLSGTFRGKLSPDGKTIRLDKFPYSSNVAERIPKDAFLVKDYARAIRRDPIQFVNTNDRIYMFDQYIRVPSFGAGNYIYPYYQDIIVTIFQSDGKVNYTMIPKTRRGFGCLSAYYSSSFIYDNKLFFFYSEPEGSSDRKAGYWVTTMDLNGNILDNKLLVDSKETDNYKWDDDVIRKDNECYVRSRKKDNSKINRITIQK